MVARTQLILAQRVNREMYVHIECNYKVLLCHRIVYFFVCLSEFRNLYEFSNQSKVSDGVCGFIWIYTTTMHNTMHKKT
jgi:hypothetical protein